jgi:DNA-binding response OmpR family regulator
LGGYFAGLRNSPSIVSPVEVTSATLPACTWSRKNVYDTVVRDVPISVEAMIQFTISASAISHQVRRKTRPQLGPLPSDVPGGDGGPPSTFHGGRSVAGRSPRSPGRSWRGGLPGRGGASVARPAIAFSPGSFARSATTTSLRQPYKLPNVADHAGVPTTEPCPCHSRQVLSPLTAELGEAAGAWEVGSVRLLVVEDEVRLAAALKRGLQAEGFTVDIAHDGVEGLHKAREGAHEGGYAAIVLDIMLPGLSGYRVCERLRAEGNWVPVLMLSAKDGEYDEADGLDVGADDYLTKPFSYVVLVARLRALLRRGAPPRPAVLAAGDLALDPAKHQVTRGETEIELTPREFSLLEYLLRRAGEVVPKVDILRNVWDPHHEGDLNVVEVYVGYLRRKIDAPFGRRAVQTVRGAGYRLAADGG